MCVVLYVSWGLYFIPVADTPVAHRAFVYSFFFGEFFRPCGVRALPPGPKVAMCFKTCGKGKEGPLVASFV